MVSFRDTALVLVGTLVVATVGYAVYFDYKRRSDSSFREKIKKDKEKMKKIVKKKEKVKKEKKTKEEPEIAGPNITLEEIMSFSAEKRMEVMQEYIAMGEMLAQRGPNFFEPASNYLCKVVRYLPNGQEVLRMIEQGYPKELFMMVVNKIKNESLIDFEIFMSSIIPNSEKIKYTVAEEAMNDPFHKGDKWKLLAKKDIEEGEVLVIENPIVSTSHDLDHHCFHCQAILDEASKATSTIGFHYCSSDCRQKASEEYERWFSEDCDEEILAFCKQDVMNALSLKLACRSTLPKDSLRLSTYIETLQFPPPTPEDIASQMGAINPNVSRFADRDRELKAFLEPTTFFVIRTFLSHHLTGFSVSEQEQNSADMKDIHITFDRESKFISGVGFYEFISYLKKSKDQEISNLVLGFENNNSIKVIAKKAIKSGEEICLYSL